MVPLDLPRYTGQPDELPALVRRFPQLGCHPNRRSRVQIGNIFDPDVPTPEPGATIGPPGTRAFSLSGGNRWLIPWAPLFPKPTPLLPADPALSSYAGAGRLFIKDEGSDRLALYGNKVRKYEYALPNITRGGGRRILTLGGLGSNHCTFLTLAARLGRFLSRERSCGLEVSLGLHPQRPDPAVIAKLKLMAALGAEMEFLPNDPAMGMAIVKRRLRETLGMGGETVYLEPGGSSPLTLLGHLDAALELDVQIRSGETALDAPPDLIFVPLGSGATATGLALGCHLLGWPTRVVATASQDKPAWIRLLFNGSAAEPFTLGHARNLLERAVAFFRRCGLEETIGHGLDAAAVMARLDCDNETWRPAYGVPSHFTNRVLEDCRALGLELDPTFSAKSFSTLVRHGRAGRLKGRRVLFWNTHHRFPLAELPMVQDFPLSRLPRPLQDYLATAGLPDQP